MVSAVALTVMGLVSGQVVESPKKGLERKKLDDIFVCQALERFRIDLNPKLIVLLLRL